MAGIELSIDFGSKYITICQRGVGLVLREPAVAIVTKVREHYEIREAGYRAESLITNAIGGAKLVSPIREGVIVDDEMCKLLITYFLKKILPSTLFTPKVSAVVSISCSMINSERKAVEKVLTECGIRDITLVESPLSLLAYTQSIGGLFLDIGGGKTEVATETTHGISSACSVNIAGDAFNKAIVDNIQKVYGIKLGDYTVERLKKSALSFYANDEGKYQVSGSSIEGTPKSLVVSAGDLRDAVVPLVDNIIEVVMSVLNTTPPDLAAEILRKGIFISGGSSKIPGIVEYISSSLSLPVTRLEDVDNAVALGGLKFLEDKSLLSDMLGVRLD